MRRRYWSLFLQVSATPDACAIRWVAALWRPGWFRRRAVCGRYCAARRRSGYIWGGGLVASGAGRQFRRPQICGGRSWSSTPQTRSAWPMWPWYGWSEPGSASEIACYKNKVRGLAERRVVTLSSGPWPKPVVSEAASLWSSNEPAKLGSCQRRRIVNLVNCLGFASKPNVPFYH